MNEGIIASCILILASLSASDLHYSMACAVICVAMHGHTRIATAASPYSRKPGLREGVIGFQLPLIVLGGGKFHGGVFS